jgi:hypothetical protein
VFALVENQSAFRFFGFFFAALSGAALAHSGRDAQAGQEPPLDKKPHSDHDHQKQ